MKKVFQNFDKDGDNCISFTEAKRVLRDFKFTDTEIMDLIKLHDSNNDGNLQYEEFVHFWNACGGKTPTGK